MFGFQPLSSTSFSTLSEDFYDPWLTVIPDANSWSLVSEVPAFVCLSSSGVSYVVTNSVLSSTGVSYLVDGDGKTSQGQIVDLTNPWQNVSVASNAWS
jgi:hypothetical protein